MISDFLLINNLLLIIRIIIIIIIISLTISRVFILLTIFLFCFVWFFLFNNIIYLKINENLIKKKRRYYKDTNIILINETLYSYLISTPCNHSTVWSFIIFIVIILL